MKVSPHHLSVVLHWSDSDGEPHLYTGSDGWATFGEEGRMWGGCRVMRHHNQGRNSQLQHSDQSVMHFFIEPCTVHSALYWAVHSAQWPQCNALQCILPYIEHSTKCRVPYIASWCEVGGVAGTVMICSVDHWVLSATLSRLIIITVRITVIITIVRVIVITLYCLPLYQGSSSSPRLQWGSLSSSPSWGSLSSSPLWGWLQSSDQPNLIGAP